MFSLNFKGMSLLASKYMFNSGICLGSVSHTAGTLELSVEVTLEYPVTIESCFDSTPSMSPSPPVNIFVLLCVGFLSSSKTKHNLLLLDWPKCVIFSSKSSCLVALFLSSIHVEVAS